MRETRVKGIDEIVSADSTLDPIQAGKLREVIFQMGEI